MHARILVATLAILGTPASAGVIANIRLSRSVPDMVAEYSWAEPKVNPGASFAGSSAPRAVLWESSATFNQIAARVAEPFEVGGAMPARIPAGAILTGWRLTSGTLALCTGNAESPSSPGKASLAVCITYVRDGDVARFQNVIVRDNDKKFATAVSTPLPHDPKLTLGVAEADNVKSRPWPGPALFFSYKQISEKGALTREPSLVGSGMTVGEYRIGDRIVLGSVKGHSVTLEHRTFELADFVAPLSAQKDSGYKAATVTVDLSAGLATARIGSAVFTVTREVDGKISVQNQTPFASNWSIDGATGRLLIDGRPFVMGAQET